jgi:hypothetical protein
MGADTTRSQTTLNAQSFLDGISEELAGTRLVSSGDADTSFCELLNEIDVLVEELSVYRNKVVFWAEVARLARYSRGRVNNILVEARRTVESGQPEKRRLRQKLLRICRPLREERRKYPYGPIEDLSRGHFFQLVDQVMDEVGVKLGADKRRVALRRYGLGYDSVNHGILNGEDDLTPNQKLVLARTIKGLRRVLLDGRADAS